MPETTADLIGRAAEAIDRADALLIGAGAGMGVDSGLPDFRGTQGFWNAYPPYARLGLGFAALANPRWFRDDPTLAWGFYGHRLELYRRTTPHPGFALLRDWAARKPLGGFVYTSNVDGHFQRAGFDPGRVVEVHGSIHAMQCTDRGRCRVGIFAADPYEIAIDEETMRAREPLPACPRCGALARPNILMFGDSEWEGTQTRAQAARYYEWLDSVRGRRLAIVECGAGTAVPSVRILSDDLADRPRGAATLVRINVREPQVPAGHIGIPRGALETLRAIGARLDTPAPRAGTSGPAPGISPSG